MSGEVHISNTYRPDRTDLKQPSSFVDSGVDLAEYQLSSSHRDSFSGRRVIRNSRHLIKGLSISSDGILATPEDQQVEQHDNGNALMQATSDKRLNDLQRHELSASDVPLPSQRSTELRELENNNASIWLHFVGLHQRAAQYRVSAEEQRRQAQMLRADFVVCIQTLSLYDRFLKLRTSDTIATSILDVLRELTNIQSSISESEMRLGETESRLVSLDWEISNLSTSVVGETGQGSAMYEALMEEGFDLGAERTPSEMSMISGDQYEPNLDDLQIKISRKLELLNVLEDLSLAIREQQSHSELVGDFSEPLGDHAYQILDANTEAADAVATQDATQTSSETELTRRQQAVRHEIEIARQELDQLRAPEISATPSESSLKTLDIISSDILLETGDHGKD